MDIIRPDGNKVDAAITEQKVHDLENLDREKQFADATYNRIMGNWVKAQQQDPKKPRLVECDQPEVDRIAIEEWRAFAKARNANSVAKKPLDEDLVKKHIEGGRMQAEQSMRMKRALHELTSLDEFGFKLVGAVPQGFLWMSLNVAVACAPKGPVYVWVRTVREDINAWCSGWMPGPVRDPVIEMVDYSVEGLHGLLLHLGVPRIVELTEEQMDMCRRVTAESADNAEGYKRDLNIIGLAVVGGAALACALIALLH